MFFQRRSSKKKSARESFSENIDEELENDPEFCIDASSFGNVSRFINHGCVPNLFVQGILSSHRDIRLARVVLFAAQDIPPYQVRIFMIFSKIVKYVFIKNNL